MARHKKERPGGLFDHPVQLLSGTGLLLALGWIGLVGSVHLHEMLVGAVVVFLCTAFCGLVYHEATLPITITLRDLAKARYLPAGIVTDAWLVLKVFLRDLSGGERAGSFYRVCGFRTSLRDPLLVGRSALAVAYSTVTPNMIVLGIDPHGNHMLFHQLQRDEVPRMTRELGAQSPQGTPSEPRR